MPPFPKVCLRDPCTLVCARGSNPGNAWLGLVPRVLAPMALRASSRSAGRSTQRVADVAPIARRMATSAPTAPSYRSRLHLLFLPPSY